MNTLLDAIRACIHVGQPTKLSGGGESNIYVELRPALLHHRSSGYILRALEDTIPGTIANVAGPILSGALIVAGLVVAGRIPRGLVIRAEQKKHGTMSLVTGPATKTGEAVWLVDDVATTYDSLWITAHNLEKERGLRVAGATVIVSRDPAAASKLWFPCGHLFTLKGLLP